MAEPTYPGLGAGVAGPVVEVDEPVMHVDVDDEPEEDIEPEPEAAAKEPWETALEQQAKSFNTDMQRMQRSIADKLSETVEAIGARMTAPGPTVAPTASAVMDEMGLTPQEQAALDEYPWIAKAIRSATAQLKRENEELKAKLPEVIGFVEQQREKEWQQTRAETTSAVAAFLKEHPEVEMTPQEFEEDVLQADDAFPESLPTPAQLSRFLKSYAVSEPDVVQAAVKAEAAKTPGKVKGVSQTPPGAAATTSGDRYEDTKFARDMRKAREGT